MLLGGNTHSSPNGGNNRGRAKAVSLEVGKPYRPDPQRKLTNVNRNGANGMR
jgi:hypothetical protein